MPEFYQESFRLRDPYESDSLLKLSLKTLLPADVLREIESDLTRFSRRIVDEIDHLGTQAENEPPRLIQYDPWGRRMDHIEVSSAWRKLDEISAEEGLVAIAYERRHGEYSRIHQFAKNYLFHPSSAYYTCPLAMTDGAAKLIEVHGDKELKEGAFRRLTSTDPKTFWTSGQWMTERSGGSDVSGTETRAVKSGDGYKLYGTKWFTSATTSQMSMTLAQMDGVKGLSLFYLELRDAEGRLDNIEILRLKDKLGTRALPTAELKLNGVKAKLVGQPGHGVRNIASLFNITRIANSAPAVATPRRVLSLLEDYSEKRVAFKKKLLEHPLHRATLADMRADTAGIFLFAIHAAKILGLSECSAGGRETNEKLLRLLTPLVKLFTAKVGTAVVTEALEGFGGAGFIEDVGIARHYRDAVVLSIWEGTTNVLCLDVERAILKEEAWPVFVDTVMERLDHVREQSLRAMCERVREDLRSVDEMVRLTMVEGAGEAAGVYRRLCFNMARTYIKSLLLELADKTHSTEVKAIAENWLERHPLMDVTDFRRLDERSRQILS